MGLLSNPPDSKHTRAKFNKWSPCYNWDVNDWDWQGPEHIFASVLNNHDTASLEDFKVADLGAGTGILTRKFINSGSDVVAFDISEKMLGELRKVNPNVPVIQSDMQAGCVPSRSDQFNIAVACGLFEFIRDSDRLISELSRITKKGGTVSFTTLETEATVQKVDRLISGLLSYVTPRKLPHRTMAHKKDSILASAGRTGLELNEHSKVKAYRPAGIGTVTYNLFNFTKI